MSAPSPLPFPALIEKLNNSLTRLSEIGDLTLKLPGSAIVWRYLKASHKDDPLRTLLELLLVFFIFRTYAQSRTKSDASKHNFVKLSEKEIDELVTEWKPEPLMVTKTPLSLPPVIIGAAGPRPRVYFPSLDQDPHVVPIPTEMAGKQMLNLASANFSGLAGNTKIRDKAIECMRRTGVGSCGPPGFYGTFDVHMELERDIANFLSVSAAIIYTQDFSTVASIIPSFSKRGDIIVADRGVNFAIQKGIQISRSTVKWYDHGDYESLEKVLENIKRDDKRTGRNPTASRRFIITEGIFESDGSMVNLPKIMELKLKHKFRLILDESWSFGAVGKTGRGVTEVFNIPASSVDILTGSMACGLSSVGGFCAGDHEVVKHQRINSPGFVYSAALPPLLAVAASQAISFLSDTSETGHPLATLPENIRAIRVILDPMSTIEIPSATMSPLIHLTIRPTFKNGIIHELSREAQEAKLQEIVDICADNGVLISRAKKNWDQELVESQRSSIRLCISSALTKKEIEKAGGVLKNAITKVLGKGKK